ncbi:MAG: hypothetical protein AAGA58_20420 [Verrucomicrobiota bacterium]
MIAYFFPLAAVGAVAAEIGVMRHRHSEVRWSLIIAIVFVANLLSWFVGDALANWLPSGLEPRIVGSGDRQFETLGPGPDFETYLIAAFAVAFVLSILLEFVVWKASQWRIQGLFRSVSIAHLASYAVLIALALAHSA